MFGTFEFIPDEGVNPAPADDRMRMQVLLADRARDSFVLSAPFAFGEMVSGLYLPPTGDGTWYLALRPGVVIDIPAQEIVWTSSSFRFQTELRAAGIGGRLVVSGSVGDDGSISGTVQPAGRGLAPFARFSGTRLESGVR
jgi:hypothetical protein